MMDNIYITYCSALQISGRQPVNYGTGARRTAGAAAAFLSDIIEVNVYSFPPFLFPRVVCFWRLAALAALANKYHILPR